jgi:alkylation response protein AidB-like acyl-CoA dehydrogenase
MANLPQIHFENLFAQDPTGQKIWNYLLSTKTFSELQPVYSRMGRNGALATEPAAASDRNPPQLRTHSSIGERIDHIDYHASYYELQKLSYGSEIVSLKYDVEFLKKYKSQRHLIGFSVAYYFAQTETGLFCPICMTDALARVLERHNSHPLAKTTLQHLTTSDLNSLWTGAMFLTEKQGGSDVGANTAQAEERDGRWFLTGDKWFCSNADAEAILALARLPGAAGELSQGTRGLGLFLVLRSQPAKNHSTWLTHRLKDKLGVRTMASGEITFQNTEAFLIGGENEGFKMMTEMVNMSRLYNAVSSVGIARRALLETMSFGLQRKAFGHSLEQLPLWRACLADLTAEFYGHLFLVFEAAKQLDQSDSGNMEAGKLARLLTPLAKALSGKLAVFAASEGMELIGGNAYIEEHILPRLLRDAQVLPIWEGTSNIQSLDLLRALQKEGSNEFFARCEAALEQHTGKPAIKMAIKSRLAQVKELLTALATFAKDDQQRAAREALEKMGRTLSLCLLAEATKDNELKSICDAAIERMLMREAATSPLAGSSALHLKSTEDILLKSIF